MTMLYYFVGLTWLVLDFCEAERFILETREQIPGYYPHLHIADRVWLTECNTLEIDERLLPCMTNPEPCEAGA